MTIAVTHRLRSPLIAPTANELRDLVLQRPLQDQPCSQAADQLHRIVLLTDASQDLIQLYAKPLARGYLLHAGVPPSSTCSGSKRRLRPQLQIPRLMRRDPRAICGRRGGPRARHRAPRPHHLGRRWAVSRHTVDLSVARQGKAAARGSTRLVRDCWRGSSEPPVCVSRGCSAHRPPRQQPVRTVVARPRCRSRDRRSCGSGGTPFRRGESCECVACGAPAPMSRT